MNYKRILSFILSILLITGTMVQVISASASTVLEPKKKDFYVSMSGSDTNDGTSHTNSVRSIKKVIELVNAAGLVAGDTATVYVDSKGSAAAQPTAIGSMSDVISYYTYGSEAVPAYTCAVTFTSFNKNGDSGTDYLGYGYMVGVSYNRYCSLAGPTVFENIVLLDVSAREDAWWDNPFNIRGNTAIFRDVKWS